MIALRPFRNLWLLGTLLALPPLGLGCAKVCSGVGYYNGARITVHLLPAADVTAPESVNACRQPDCVTATLPVLAGDSPLMRVDFSSADVTGFLGEQDSGLRLLTIDWIAHDLSANRNFNNYDIRITDATGAVTGGLDKLATYTRDMPSGEGCGDRWWTEITD